MELEILRRYLMEARREPLAILTNLRFGPERLINVQSGKSIAVESKHYHLIRTENITVEKSDVKYLSTVHAFCHKHVCVDV